MNVMAEVQTHTGCRNDKKHYQVMRFSKLVNLSWCRYEQIKAQSSLIYGGCIPGGLVNIKTVPKYFVFLYQMEYILGLV